MGFNSGFKGLTAIRLSPGGSTRLHTNNTQNNTNSNRTTQITTNVEECGPCPVFASFTLAFALQLTKKHKTHKAIPLQAWTGPEGFRRLRLPDFKTIGT